MRKIVLVGCALAMLVAVALFWKVPGGNQDKLVPTALPATVVKKMDFSAYTDAPPSNPLQLLFIHHSCGGQLFAPPGVNAGDNCIYPSHRNGGGLRPLLEQNSYGVHEASYGSRIGEDTDLFDWVPKFQNQMELILTCDRQDTSYTDGRRNQIVVFKSCFPNNAFQGEGVSPGNPAGPELTVWNAQAAYQALRDIFEKHPNVLFVCVTAPPLAPQNSSQPLWRYLARKLLRRSNVNPATSAPLARQFNNWLSGTDGWLKDYPLKNVVVFDYYDVLTGHGASDLSIYPTGDGSDSHPSREGNTLAAKAFVPFLNRAARRAGLSP